MSFFGTSTPASKRYQRRFLVTMSIYLVVLFAAILVVKHTRPHGWQLYTISVVPAVPLLAMLGALGVYLTEETDEYIRLITMRSLLVGTAVLLAMLVVDEVLRSISGAGALPPFTSWVTFFMAFGVAQAVQRMRNRVKDDA